MTKLKEEIRLAIWQNMRKDDNGDRCIYEGGELDEEVVPDVAEVAKKYIEEAFDKGVLVASRPEMQGVPFIQILPIKNEWLKENGITDFS